MVCRASGQDGALSVMRMPATADGVSMSPRNPAAFMPELPAARMQLQDVVLDASAMLPGDGWTDYARPFGALEELYVSVALMGYLLREGRARDWPQAMLRQMLATITLLERIAAEVESDQGLVLLAGATEWVRTLMTRATAQWADQPEDAGGQRWARDQTVQRMWADAGARRGDRAWQALSPSE